MKGEGGGSSPQDGPLPQDKMSTNQDRHSRPAAHRLKERSRSGLSKLIDRSISLAERPRPKVGLSRIGALADPRCLE